MLFEPIQTLLELTFSMGGLALIVAFWLVLRFAKGWK